MKLYGSLIFRELKPFVSKKFAGQETPLYMPFTAFLWDRFYVVPSPAKETRTRFRGACPVAKLPIRLAVELPDKPYGGAGGKKIV